MGFSSEIVTPPVYVGRFGGIGENVALTVKKINGRVSVDVILDGRRMHGDVGLGFPLRND